MATEHPEFAKQHMYWYRAFVKRVVDGDTVHVEIDKGMRDSSQESIRVEGVDCWEIFRPKNDDEKKRGFKAKTFVEDWIHEAGHIVYINTVKDKQTFNRYRGHIYNKLGESLADALIEAGHDKLTFTGD